MHRRAGVMHVITQVRRDEVVARLGVILQVGGQLRKGTHMSDTGGGGGIIGIGHVVEEDHGIVLGGVQAAALERTDRAIDIFLVRLPGDTSLIEQSHEMLCRMLVIDSRVIVGGHAEIGTGFQP